MRLGISSSSVWDIRLQLRESPGFSRGEDVNDSLIELHLCIQCREPIAEFNPRTGKRFTRCAKCRKYQAKRRFGYYTNEKTKLLAEHKCLVCKEEVEEINEKTGKPFQTCPTCRDLRRVLNKGYINAKKGAA